MARLCAAFPGAIHVDYQGTSEAKVAESATSGGNGSAEDGDVASFFAPDGFHPGPKALDFMATHLLEEFQWQDQEAGKKTKVTFAPRQK